MDLTTRCLDVPADRSVLDGIDAGGDKFNGQVISGSQEIVFHMDSTD